MKLTENDKLRRDDAIATLWRVKKTQGWQMKWLAPVFGLHTDTIYLKIKQARERKIITK